MSGLIVSGAKIQHLEDEMLKLPQVELPVENYFCDGMYGRKITIPAGTTLTGRVHLQETMNILAAGEISVLTENGIQRLSAGAVTCSKPGMKRVGYAHTDCVWITIMRSELEDPDEIVNTCTVSRFEEFERISSSQLELLLEN